jgi:hypothetical protein
LKKGFAALFGFILLTSTIVPTLTPEIHAQNTISCPEFFNTFGVEYFLLAGKATSTKPENSIVICTYESEDAQHFDFPKNPYFTISWSSIEAETMGTGFCHQLQKIYRGPDDLQIFYSNEKIAKVNVFRTNGIPLEDVESFTTNLLQQAESLAAICPDGTSKSSIDKKYKPIDCPDTFSTKKIGYTLDRTYFKIDDLQNMRWNCEYKIQNYVAKDNNILDRVTFSIAWIQELGPYKYDEGCTEEPIRGDKFVTSGVSRQLHSQTFHAKALVNIHKDYSVPTSDLDPILKNLLTQAESIAKSCFWDDDSSFEEIEKEPEPPEEPSCFAGPVSQFTRKVGKFELVIGEVQILRMGQDEWTQVSQNDEIQLGDWIKTGSSGGAIIQWPHWKGEELDNDSSMVGLSHDSELCVGEFAENFEDIGLLEQYEDTGFINLIDGMLRAWYHHEREKERERILNFLIEVRGPYVFGNRLIQSRGTDFILSHEPVENSSKIYLKEGILDITQIYTGEKITLTEGQVLEISNGEDQPVTFLNSKEWNSLISETGGITTEIPSWVKNNAGWWADDMIGDSDFAQGIQYLISEGIMTIPETTPTETTGGSDEIPSWIKNNAGWWADGAITDDDFVKGIQYLVEQGIIQV